jgi:hypothetical protein
VAQVAYFLAWAVVASACSLEILQNLAFGFFDVSVKVIVPGLHTIMIA